MRKVSFITLLLLAATSAAYSQRVLSLDSCRALAIRNNKQLNMSRLGKEVAMNIRKAARTKYLPKVDALGGYELTSREISMLSNDQKGLLNNIGTAGIQRIGSGITTGITNGLANLVQQGILTPGVATQVGSALQQLGNGPITQYIAGLGNSIGEEITRAFRTDTRNIFAGAIMLRQPIFMGGAIDAANQIADIGELMAENNLNMKTQATLFTIDHTYWTVVSLREKQKLATSYRDLVKKFDDDVSKMIRQGVATRADKLKVDVKVNEADMQITQVEDGLALAKMLLCQLCGIPVDEEITLADEDSNELSITAETNSESSVPDSSFSNRPEVRMLQNAVDISEQNTRLVRSLYLPHVALTGGYAISNPNVFNGFQKRFAGVWNVGVVVHVPVWNWMEGAYKVRASKAATSMARMELADVQEKINLQVTQSRFKVKEARKRLTMAEKNIKSADENLRCAQVGFKEGVMQSTEVLAAQTAWQMAKSQVIDAKVELKLALVNLQKALGTLN